MIDIPKYLNELINKDYPNDYLDITSGFKEKRYTTFRINNILSSKEEINSFLLENKIIVKKGINDDSFIDLSNINYNKLDIYNSGKIYLQSLSSMIPPFVLSPKEKEVILDMTAAPGSKTSLIQDITKNTSEVMAIEIDKIRCERLKYNLNKLGVKNVNVENINALSLDDYFMFDKILLDAPCSGSGTLSIFNDSIDKFSIKLVKNSSLLQKKLLEKAIKICKKGGCIVYSTCSILKCENEEVIKPFIDKGLVEICKIDNIWSLPTLPSNIDGVLTIKPTKEFEGFFVAKLIKK